MSATKPKPVTPPQPIKNFFVIRHPYVTAEDDDIIKITAQFTACHGLQFVKELAQREGKNPIYAFLKEDNPNYPYFAALCDSYNKCLHPKRPYIDFLRRTMTNEHTLLKYVLMRAEYENERERQRKTDEEQRRREEELFNSIDWHNFVIVETIDFEEGEALPVPQQFALQEPEPEVKECREEPAEAQPVAPVVEDLPAEKPYKDKPVEPMQECPICRKYIPVRVFDEHIRFEMSKPQKRAPQRYQDSPLVSGKEIAANLRVLAKKRSNWQD